MLTRNLTPFLFAAKLCSRRPPQPEMTLIVRASFALAPGRPLEPAEDQGALTAEVFHEDDDARLGECLYAGDFADFKLNAEVLVKGTCYAPRGRPVVECPVRVNVGAWSKTLRLIGPRAWSSNVPGAAPSEPRSFTSMPLTYQGAFGGPDFLRNPVGTGHGSLDLPTVENPNELIRSRGDQPTPAGFGPLNPAWPQRSGKLGKEYGKTYREKRAPYYAEDFDWSYFSAAPADQQLQGYLRGDEEVAFHNLHPTATSIEARLPGIRIRAFIKDLEQRFREVYLAIDTLFADLDAGILSLTWRGVDKVREDDLTDIKTVLVASEPLTSRALPEAYYRTLLEEFESDPVGLAAAIPPGLAEAEDLLERERRGEIPPMIAGAEDPLSALLGSKLGKGGASEHADVLKAVSDARSKAGPDSKIDEALTRAVGGVASSPPFVVPLKPGSMPPLRLRDTMRSVLAAVADLKKSAAASNIELKEPQLAQIAALEAMPTDPRWSKLDPTYKPPGPVSTDEPGPGKDLSEQDLTGRDLSGLDLSFANLEGTILTEANLRGTNLRSANLTTAVLYRADLSGADLRSANLTQANLTSAELVLANLGGAVLEQAFFEGANLTDGNLAEASGEYVAFMKANLTRCQLHKARLDHSDFSEASLEQVSFVKASLDGAVFDQCEGKQVDFTNARLATASFEKARLRGAKFIQIRGERSLWTGATLDGADFAYAHMPASHFTEASAVAARFYGANLRECRFYRASLERAEIVSANLFSADLCKSNLSGARFNNSSLYDAKFLQASGAGCDFTGANLKRSTLERA